VHTSSDHIDTAVPDEQRSHSRGRESQGERDQQASVEAAMRLFPVAPISVVGETGLPAEEEPLPRGGAGHARPRLAARCRRDRAGSEKGALRRDCVRVRWRGPQ
jgi:hypothetical protein